MFGTCDDQVVPTEVQVTSKRIAAGIQGQSQQTVVTPFVFRRESGVPDIVHIDLVVAIEGEPIVVIDPFFRAPGLQFAFLRIFDEDLVDVRTLSIARQAPEGAPVVGSLLLPRDGLVGARLPLKVFPRGGEPVQYYCQLFLQSGFAVPDSGAAQPLKLDVVARSDAIPIGEFPLFSRVALLGYGSLASSEREPLQQADTWPVGVESYRSDTDQVLLMYCNFTTRDAVVFDPWLRRYGMTDSPVALWVRSGSNETNLLRYVGPSYVAPDRKLRSEIPAGAIVGRRFNIPQLYADDPNVEIEVKVSANFFEPSVP